MKFSDWLAEDKTIPQLQQHIQQGFPNTKKRQHATHEVRITKLQYLPITNKEILRITANTTSTNGNPHKQILDLQNVNFQPPNSGNNVVIQDLGGHPHSITPVVLNINNVKVYCDCEDYQMRFAHYNIENNCHIGPPPAPYTRKTDTRPEANPNHVPGLCKHLLAVVSDLKQQKVLK